MIELYEPRLGSLQFKEDPFCVVAYEIGSRAHREEVNVRALASGGDDATRFGGGRAATITLRLHTPQCRHDGLHSELTMQELYDLVMPYTVPRRRVDLRWSLPGTDELRQLRWGRIPSAPVVVAAPRHPTLMLSYVSADGEITAVQPESPVLIEPAVDVEDGRTYNATYPKAYPPTAAVGDRTVFQGGNEIAHWQGVLYGEATDPYIRVNGVDVSFAGLTINLGESVVIDTRRRTMWRNGVVGDSVYHLSNFTQWAWEDIMLQPLRNLVRFGGQALGSTARLQMSYSKTYAG